MSKTQEQVLDEVFELTKGGDVSIDGIVCTGKSDGKGERFEFDRLTLGLVKDGKEYGLVITGPIRLQLDHYGPTEQRPSKAGTTTA